MRVWPGSPAPLGATFDGAGVNFALFSAHAAGVELCLFDGAEAPQERARVPLRERTGSVWHGYLPDVGPGQLYGYRVSGPWNPRAGDRFNASKIVLDPYARALGRGVSWNDALFAFDRRTAGDGAADLSDSAPFAPLASVAGGDAPFAWGADRPPAVPWRDTIIYELHVKGFTALHAAMPPALRGTYLGLASPAAIAHLTSLGVTAVELLPVHAHADEWQLAAHGRTNYWGYNTLAYFVPDVRFVSTGSFADAGAEFKTMVAALHAAGLEVILDVVYNHTAEGDHLGPTLSMRGIDNRSYYRLEPACPSHYVNVTGCGNTLDLGSTAVLQLVADNLRFWIDEMHVDGFRFDLATVLGRESADFDPSASFFDILRQDPVISRAKLIAEPWDVGEGGYQLGRFPAGWSEWNDHFRDDVRRFWRGDAGMIPALATRLAGSSDVFGGQQRAPSASVNFITAHDGFTLTDLVTYDVKHNELNGEDNRDGENHNNSWNSGVEGPTDDPAIVALRLRQRKNLLVTLLLSLGTPMLSGGDELGRSQSGNNNPYTQDSSVSWTPWHTDEETASFLWFVQALVALRRREPVLNRRTFLDERDVRWLRPDGGEMTTADWQDGDRRAFGMLLDGTAIREAGFDGEARTGASLAVLFNAADTPADFRVPGAPDGLDWTRVVDTASPFDAPVPVDSTPALSVAPRSVVVLRSGRAEGRSWE